MVLGPGMTLNNAGVNQAFWRPYLPSIIGALQRASDDMRHSLHQRHMIWMFFHDSFKGLQLVCCIRVSGGWHTFVSFWGIVESTYQAYAHIEDGYSTRVPPQWRIQMHGPQSWS